MDWRDSVVADIGRAMGIDGLEFGASGVISFEFENRGTLFMELQEDGVLIYLVRRIPQFDTAHLLVSALKACHYTKSLSFPLQAGLKQDDELVFMVYLINEAFTLPNAEGVIELLTRQFEQQVVA
ncbi:type III secretion chaperone SycN [Endozoicomonas sp. OPT23]|uniref:type III secretion chaperone SycN n=1 Tax=Endozoicomonas sp. OPT23 TaxID=2072845 RepID=UPI00129AA66F|nr:type III secretion chaperone SycN [Endozoicomonas sp. OPT23]MRI32161.1 type III secretion chaperone SycN [Endozoicomonas sp. OPT23]